MTETLQNKISQDTPVDESASKYWESTRQLMESIAELQDQSLTEIEKHQAFFTLYKDQSFQDLLSSNKQEYSALSDELKALYDYDSVQKQWKRELMSLAHEIGFKEARLMAQSNSSKAFERHKDNARTVERLLKFLDFEDAANDFADQAKLFEDKYQINDIHQEFQQEYKELSNISADNVFENEFIKKKDRLKELVENFSIKYQNIQRNDSEWLDNFNKIFSVTERPAELWAALKKRADRISDDREQSKTMDQTGLFEELREKFQAKKREKGDKAKVDYYLTSNSILGDEDDSRQIDSTEHIFEESDETTSISVEEALEVLEQRYRTYSYFKYRENSRRIKRLIPGKSPEEIEEVWVSQKDRHGLMPLNALDQNVQAEYNSSIALLEEHKRITRDVRMKVDQVRDYFRDQPLIRELDPLIIVDADLNELEGTTGTVPFLLEKWQARKKELIEEKTEDLREQISRIKKLFGANPESALTEVNALQIRLSAYKEQAAFESLFNKTAELAGQFTEWISELYNLEKTRDVDELEKNIKVFIEKIKLFDDEIRIPTRIENLSHRVESAKRPMAAIDRCRDDKDGYYAALDAIESFKKLSSVRVRNTKGELEGLLKNELFIDPDTDALREKKIEIDELLEEVKLLEVALKARDDLKLNVIEDYSTITKSFDQLDSSNFADNHSLILMHLKQLHSEKQAVDESVRPVVASAQDYLGKSPFDLFRLVDHLQKIQASLKTPSSFQKKLFQLEEKYQEHIDRMCRGRIQQYMDRIDACDNIPGKKVTSEEIIGFGNLLGGLDRVSIPGISHLLYDAKIKLNFGQALLQEQESQWHGAVLAWSKAQQESRMNACQKIEVLQDVIDNKKTPGLDSILGTLSFDYDIFLTQKYWKFQEMYDSALEAENILSGQLPDFTPLENEMVRGKVQGQESGLTQIWLLKGYEQKFQGYKTFKSKLYGLSDQIKTKVAFLEDLYDISSKLKPISSLMEMHLTIHRINEKQTDENFNAVWPSYKEHLLNVVFANKDNDQLVAIKRWILEGETNISDVVFYLTEYLEQLRPEVRAWFDPDHYLGKIGAGLKAIDVHVKGAREQKDKLEDLNAFVHQFHTGTKELKNIIDGIYLLKNGGIDSGKGESKGGSTLDEKLHKFETLQNLVADTTVKITEVTLHALFPNWQFEWEGVKNFWKGGAVHNDLIHHPTTIFVDEELMRKEDLVKNVKEIAASFKRIIELDLIYGRKGLSKQIPDGNFALKGFLAFITDSKTNRSVSWTSWGLSLLKELEDLDSSYQTDWQNQIMLVAETGKELRYPAYEYKLLNAEEQLKLINDNIQKCHRNPLPSLMEFEKEKVNASYMAGIEQFLTAFCGAKFTSTDHESYNSDDQILELFDGLIKRTEQYSAIFGTEKEVVWGDVEHKDYSIIKISDNKKDFLSAANQRIEFTGEIYKNGFTYLSKWNEEQGEELQILRNQVFEAVSGQIEFLRSFKNHYLVYLELRDSYIAAEQKYSDLKYSGVIVRLVKGKTLKELEGELLKAAKALKRHASGCKEVLRYEKKYGVVALGEM